MRDRLWRPGGRCVWDAGDGVLGVVLVMVLYLELAWHQELALGCHIVGGDFRSLSR